MNIKTFIMAAAIMPAVALAQETTTKQDTTATKDTCDTTFVFNKQKFEISQKGERTNVKVYKKNGTEMTKTLETQYLDGQEVEQVYVTSPFIPRKTAKRHSQEYSHYPFIFFGGNMMAGSAFGTSSDDKYIRDSKSGEWGFYGCSFECPISSSWAITSALSVAFVSHHFNTDYVLNTTDGITSLQPFANVWQNNGDEDNDQHPSKSYLSYWTTRIPIMAEWSRKIGRDDVYAAFGPSIEFRFKERSRYKLDKRHTLTRDVNMNPVGINLEARLGYGFLMLYARTALTPLLRTKYAPEWHPFTVGIGIRL